MRDVDEKLKKGRQRGSLQQRSLFVSAAFLPVHSETFVSQKTRQSVYFKSSTLVASGGAVTPALELFKFP